MLNKVILIGRLTKDPELKFTPSGTAVASLTLAVDRRKSKDGQKETDFINIVVWGKTAENTANYMSKGKLISVSGRLQTRSYEAKDGTKRYVAEVVADEVIFLEKGNNGNNTVANDNNATNSSSYEDDVVTPIDDSDIPF